MGWQDRPYMIVKDRGEGSECLLGPDGRWVCQFDQALHFPSYQEAQDEMNRLPPDVAATCEVVRRRSQDRYGLAAP